MLGVARVGSGQVGLKGLDLGLQGLNVGFEGVHERLVRTPVCSG